ncbi:MAG: hypothetical protein IJ890_05850 [Clostridia bacterium]|nr:hypothetical protein [Clostridia bacterium]
MRFPVLTENPKDSSGLQSNNYMMQKRCVECIFSVAQALICRLNGVERSDDVKLRYISVTDCHNGANDWFSVNIGISRNGYATEYSTFTTPSDTQEMRHVFREIFEQYAEVEDIFNSEAELEGVCLNIAGFGKKFLSDFGSYINTVEGMMDSKIINQYGFINWFGIPKESFTEMRKKFDELTSRYC